MEKIPMTAAGFKGLEAELEQLKNVERHEIIKAIAEARAHGDLSENAEYHAAKEKQSFIEGRVMELEDQIGRADVIDITKLSGTSIKFGAHPHPPSPWWTRTPMPSASSRSWAMWNPTPRRAKSRCPAPSRAP